jgi:hypothetical protein
MSGMPPKVREGREIMMMITIANIKKIKGYCAKLYEKSAQIWTKIVEHLEIKAIEAKLRYVQEHAKKAS